MASFWIKWFKPLLLLLAASANGTPSVVPVLNYPANPSYVQAHGHFLPIPSSPTTFTTQTLGLPVLSSQSSFFLKSLQPLVNTGTSVVPIPSAPATPLVPFPTASVPLPTAPLPPASTPIVPLPTATPFIPPPRSAPVPSLLIYSDGTVVPLSDTHYKFPPILEGFINRVQNYFSNYAQIDPNSVPFPIKIQRPSHSAENSSTAAITTTTTTTTTAKTFGPAINLRLVAAPNTQQHQPGVGFTRTSTVPTSTGRTAKLVEVFRPDGKLSGSLVQSAEDNQTPLAIATATATVNFDGSDQNRPSPEFGPNPPSPDRPLPPPPNRPAQSPNYPAQPANRPSQSPNYPTQSPNYPTQSPNYPTQSPNYPTQSPNHPAQPPNRPRPEKPRPNPRPDPPNGYRYDRPQFRPLEYDVPPKPEAYRSRGPF